MSESKTIARVYEEVIGSAALQKEFFAAEKNGAIEEFAAAHGCKATAGEVQAFLKARLSEPGELSMDELDMVTGGGKDTQTMAAGRAHTAVIGISGNLVSYIVLVLFWSIMNVSNANAHGQ